MDDSQCCTSVELIEKYYNDYLLELSERVQINFVTLQMPLIKICVIYVMRIASAFCVGCHFNYPSRNLICRTPPTWSR